MWNTCILHGKYDGENPTQDHNTFNQRAVQDVLPCKELVDKNEAKDIQKIVWR